MELEHLYDTEMRYDAPIPVEVAWNGQGLGVGRGTGTAHGRVAGRIEWVNTPALRADGVFQPDVTGVIHVEGGGRVVYQAQGLSLAPRDDEPDHRRFSTAVRFTTSHDPLRWLNDLLAVEEGVIDTRDGSFTTRVLAVRHTRSPA